MRRVKKKKKSVTVLGNLEDYAKDSPTKATKMASALCVVHLPLSLDLAFLFTPHVNSAR